MIPHPDDARWYVGGQVNVILQAHPDFRALYSGPNSLHADGETKVSRVLTLFTGYQLTGTTNAIFDLESSGGRGISDALGLAGFTNLDVVRNPELGSKPYVARAMLHQIIPLGHVEEKSERTSFSLATSVPVRRLEFRIGRMSLADFFDQNTVGSDSHFQFLNWTIDNNGGYDYAADTRGYTYAAMLEFDDHWWSLRFAEALMPKVANGIDLDWNLRRARAENLELELRPTSRTTFRALSYVNHANMGDYRAANIAFLDHQDAAPDITAHRRQGRVKYGFGLNLQQELTHGLRVYGRFGWNEGRHESFAYTEVNQSFSFGADLSGRNWRRKQDRVGAAFVTNGISRDHQAYLALGGQGFLLGDGRLTYGREQIFESYYTVHLWKGLYGSFDLQHVTNPGYNRDRGPVWVPGVRLHLEI